MSLHWIKIENPKGFKKPEWMRSSAMDDFGVVYIPAAIAGNENAIFLCAAFDGQECALDSGHLYVNAQWMKNNYPEVADICDLIQTKTREHFGIVNKPPNVAHEPRCTAMPERSGD